MRARFAELEQRGPKAAILAFVAEFMEQALGGAGQGQCLLVNTAMEVDPQDAELAARVAGYLGEIEAFLRRNLAAARAAGEIPPELDPEETAGMLLAVPARRQRSRPSAAGCGTPLESMVSPTTRLT